MYALNQKNTKKLLAMCADTARVELRKGDKLIWSADASSSRRQPYTGVGGAFQRIFDTVVPLGAAEKAALRPLLVPPCTDCVLVLTDRGT
jgi:hypothetical protein